MLINNHLIISLHILSSFIFISSNYLTNYLFKYLSIYLSNYLSSIENYELHFNWYPYTGEEAPMPLDDIEHFFEEEEEGNSFWVHTINL